MTATTDKRPKVRYVSNPAAFGAEWTEPSGTRAQLVALPNTTTLILGVFATGKWHQVLIVNPERFTDGPVKTSAQFKGVVEKWFAAIERED